MSLDNIDTVKDLLIDEQIENGRLHARVDKLRADKRQLTGALDRAVEWLNDIFSEAGQQSITANYFIEENERQPYSRGG